MTARQWIAASTAICLALPLAYGAGAKEPVRGRHAMVVAQEPLAADAGLEILRRGGNAIDAAVAVGFALAVTYPAAGNIGGGGFMLVRLKTGRSYFLDFREEAPSRATRDMYVGKDGKPTDESLTGWRAPGVPGSVKGFETAAHKWGTMKFADLLEPAIHLASNGFAVNKPLADELKKSKTLPKNAESRRIFQRNGRFYEERETFRQPELAATLKRIAQHGSADFYEGQTAQKIAAAMKEHGGLITLDDLKHYKAIDRQPLEGNYNGYHVITAPPPSAGGVGLLQMMGMLAGTNYGSDGPDSPRAVHYEAEAMRRFYADRSEYFGDPDFYHVPVSQLLNPGYIRNRRNSIVPGRATPSSEVSPGDLQLAAARVYQTESNETTHFNVVDSEGNAVAVTYTLNGGFGSGVTPEGLGFLLNNEMDDFSAKPGSPNMFGLVGGDANAIAPGKRPLSSMTPTIITQNGKLFMAVGAPGGSRITTGVMQVILDVIDFHMDAQAAVDLPRFHHQWKPDTLYLQNGFDAKSADALRGMGYQTKSTDGVAEVQAIVAKDGILEGGTESRLAGKVAAY